MKEDSKQYGKFVIRDAREIVLLTQEEYDEKLKREKLPAREFPDYEESQSPMAKVTGL